MDMSIIPSTYKHADRLPVDAKISTDAAARYWRELAAHAVWRRALRHYDPRQPVRPCVEFAARTLEAMVREGLLEPDVHAVVVYRFTGWGSLVREAGTRSTVGT